MKGLYQLVGKQLDFVRKAGLWLVLKDEYGWLVMPCFRQAFRKEVNNQPAICILRMGTIDLRIKVLIQIKPLWIEVLDLSQVIVCTGQCNSVSPRLLEHFRLRLGISP